MLQFGDKLKIFIEKKYRSHGGISDFAKEINATQPQVSNWIAKNIVPMGETMQKIAALGCNMNWLLGDERKHPDMFAESESILSMNIRGLDKPFYEAAQEISELIDMLKNSKDDPRRALMNIDKISAQSIFVIRYLLSTIKQLNEETQKLSTEVMVKEKEIQYGKTKNYNENLVFLKKKLEELGLETGRNL